MSEPRDWSKVTITIVCVICRAPLDRPLSECLGAVICADQDACKARTEAREGPPK